MHAAEARHGLPPGVLQAIALTESGRTDATSHVARPWPWAVQAEGQSRFFDTRDEAVDWVRSALTRGVQSIDVGCLQVNLHFHPAAFPDLDAAFDPVGNADYAARFLQQLHQAAADWGQAIGFYHSHTDALAAPYRRIVARRLGGGSPIVPADTPAAMTTVARLAAAWRATVPGSGQIAAASEGGPEHVWGQPVHASGQLILLASRPVRRSPLKGRSYAFDQR